MTRVLLYIIITCLFECGCCGCAHAAKGDAVASNVTSACGSHGSMVLSAVYSPYSVHVIRSEVSGRIIRINGREGQVLKAGTPVIEIDSKALRSQLVQLQSVLSSLGRSERVLARDLELTRKKYDRYLTLRKRGHVEEQAVENIEQELHTSELALIENRRQQADCRKNIIDLTDRINKCAPSFTRDFYVAENFRELFETVVPGEKVSRLMDVSRAKVHLVLPPGCFSVMEKILRSEKIIPFQLVTEDAGTYSLSGSPEKLKIDPDNSYLYSYGFDLVFQPVKDILWGQVVKVRLILKGQADPSAKGEPAAKQGH